MASDLNLSGVWPSPISIGRGWAKATARPWNQEGPDAFIRLERGGADFLAAVTDYLIEITSAPVYSPAMYPSSTRVWKRAGYTEAENLEVFERATITTGPPGVAPAKTIDWPTIQAIDDASFEGFWRMSTDGLKEALDSTRQSSLLVYGEDSIVGYAIVGAQWNMSYLQRIAVLPDRTGYGIGRALLDGALAWGRRQGAPTMILNVRAENLKARRLYESAGFVATGTNLRILRYDSSP